MDRYGNQFATRVEKNVEVGTISADILFTPQGMFTLAVGGVILNVQYISQEDAVDAADVILCRLAEGEPAVEVLPIEGYRHEEPEQEPDYEDVDKEGYMGDWIPTRGDAADHNDDYRSQEFRTVKEFMAWLEE